MPAPPAWRLAVAPVIARDPYTWNRRFRIGKGALHGITLGAAVLAGNQVIGRIHELSARSAVVATLADPACKLSVHLPGSNAVGILAGRADQHWHEPPFCLVTFLPRDADYQPGDYVLTSGLGDAVPAGLPVGRVMPFPDGASKRIASAAYAELLVRPGADFAGFRDVAVLVPLPPPAPHSPGPP
ncbi:MAG: rod shape-determining protein MreC [Lentisphaeria bacterium]